MAGVDVDEQVQIAVRARVPASDGAEDANVAHAEPPPDLHDLRAMTPHTSRLTARRGAPTDTWTSLGRVVSSGCRNALRMAPRNVITHSGRPDRFHRRDHRSAPPAESQPTATRTDQRAAPFNLRSSGACQRDGTGLSRRLPRSWDQPGCQAGPHVVGSRGDQVPAQQPLPVVSRAAHGDCGTERALCPALRTCDDDHAPRRHRQPGPRGAKT